MIKRLGKGPAASFWRWNLVTKCRQERFVRWWNFEEIIWHTLTNQRRVDISSSAQKAITRTPKFNWLMTRRRRNRNLRRSKMLAKGKFRRDCHDPMDRFKAEIRF